MHKNKPLPWLLPPQKPQTVQMSTPPTKAPDNKDLGKPGREPHDISGFFVKSAKCIRRPPVPVIHLCRLEQMRNNPKQRHPIPLYWVPPLLVRCGPPFFITWVAAEPNVGVPHRSSVAQRGRPTATGECPRHKDTHINSGYVCPLMYTHSDTHTHNAYL